MSELTIKPTDQLLIKVSQLLTVVYGYTFESNINGQWIYTNSFGKYVISESAFMGNLKIDYSNKGGFSHSRNIDLSDFIDTIREFETIDQSFNTIKFSDLDNLISLMKKLGYIYDEDHIDNFTFIGERAWFYLSPRNGGGYTISFFKKVKSGRMLFNDSFFIIPNINDDVEFYPYLDGIYTYEQLICFLGICHKKFRIKELNNVWKKVIDGFEKVDEMEKVEKALDEIFENAGKKEIPVKKDIYTEISDILEGMIEKDGLFWTKPWFVSSLGANSVNGLKEYRGINQILLTMFGLKYRSRTWGTFKSLKAKGFGVKKGEKGMPVFFFNFIKKTVEDEKTGEEKTIKFPILKRYTVFNIEQTDISSEKLEKYLPAKLESGENIVKLDDAEILVNAYLEREGMELVNNCDHAFYNPSADFVGMPDISFFVSSEAYYGTLFHELVHSTGHEKRLDRFAKTGSCFGNHEYSKEELVAEIGASFLSGELGIWNQKEQEQSGAYIQGWLKALKSDKKFFFEAISKAQKSVDYIKGIKFENCPNSDESK